MKGCNIKRGFQPKIIVCWDGTGNLIPGEQQILNRWAEYLKNVSTATKCNL
jgi:hypothetical protein